MKKLSPNQVKIVEFELLSSQASPRQLFKVNTDLYIITLFDRETQTFGFESEVFTDLLTDLGGGITDVTLLQMQESERSEDLLSEHFEIRLHFESGEIVSINSNDRVYLMHPTSYGRDDEIQNVQPAGEIWDLPDVYPFSHLQMSDNLVGKLLPLTDRLSPSDILNQLWSDYQAITQDEWIKPPIKCFTIVHGKYFTFRATEHNCGKVTLSI